MHMHGRQVVWTGGRARWRAVVGGWRDGMRPARRPSTDQPSTSLPSAEAPRGQHRATPLEPRTTMLHAHDSPTRDEAPVPTQSRIPMCDRVPRTTDSPLVRAWEPATGTLRETLCERVSLRTLTLWGFGHVGRSSASQPAIEPSQMVGCACTFTPNMNGAGVAKRSALLSHGQGPLLYRGRSRFTHTIHARMQEANPQPNATRGGATISPCAREHHQTIAGRRGLGRGAAIIRVA